MIDLILEGFLAVLLVAVIASCFVISRRLGAMRSGQDELRSLIAQLNSAVEQAQRSVLHLKSEGAAAEESLTKTVTRAQALADELSLITEAADSLAGRIESGVDGLRQRQSLAAANDELFEDDGREDDFAAKQDILEALREAR